MRQASEKNEKTYEELFCSTELTRGTHNLLICLLAMNIVLSVITFLGNTLILVAFRKTTVFHSPSKILYLSLATTDLCVGVISEPLIVGYWISVVKERWDICRQAQALIFITGHALSSVSLFTLTAISVDRLVALMLGLRYRRIVTSKRTYITVGAFWVVSIGGATMYFQKYHATLLYGYIGTAVCLAISLLSYTKIFLTFRRRRKLRHEQSFMQLGQCSQLDTTWYRKAVSNALWLQLILVVCYLPYGIVGIIMNQKGLSSPVYVARQFALTLVLLNSTLNPFFYCWKIGEVRQAVTATIRQYLPSLPGEVRSIHITAG